jgi:hypothetical protein
MSTGTKVVLAIASVAVPLTLLAIWVFFYLPHSKPLQLRGAVLVQDADPGKRLPVADTAVTVISDAAATVTGKSDASGYFNVQLPVAVRRGRAITLQFRHREYKPLEVHDYVADKLYVVEMAPYVRKAAPPSNQSRTMVANLRVRYSIKAMTTVNIGSAVKTFEVRNVGNVSCKGQHPCSPDGMWKASIGPVTLDAGAGNEFRNVRVSCIAGPCPFSRIEEDGFSRGGQKISASVRAWSDTVTYLLEAEVFHPMVSEVVHESHPVIFGRSLNFTLPASAEGVCIEADVAGQTIIYPLGPALFLSWANCDATGRPDQAKVYRCELKPEYQFPESAQQELPTVTQNR